jgi:hypothetical protein
MLPDARHGETARSTLTAMNCAERVAEHVNGETVVDAGRSSGADPEREALGFPSNTILAVTDGQALYAFHRDPHDGLIGRWPLGEVGGQTGHPRVQPQLPRDRRNVGTAAEFR